MSYYLLLPGTVMGTEYVFNLQRKEGISEARKKRERKEKMKGDFAGEK